MLSVIGPHGYGMPAKRMLKVPGCTDEASFQDVSENGGHQSADGGGGAIGHRTGQITTKTIEGLGITDSIVERRSKIPVASGDCNSSAASQNTNRRI